MLNSVSAIGRLFQDPVITRDDGTIMAKFDLIVHEFYRQNSELMKRVHRLPCKVFGRLAELSGEFLRRGSQVGIRGSIQSTNNGSPLLIIVVNELEFLSSHAPAEAPTD